MTEYRKPDLSIIPTPATPSGIPWRCHTPWHPWGAWHEPIVTQETRDGVGRVISTQMGQRRSCTGCHLIDERRIR